jgi:hypothetical protein
VIGQGRPIAVGLLLKLEHVKAVARIKSNEGIVSSLVLVSGDEIT